MVRTDSLPVVLRIVVGCTGVDAGRLSAHKICLRPRSLSLEWERKSLTSVARANYYTESIALWDRPLDPPRHLIFTSMMSVSTGCGSRRTFSIGSNHFIAESVSANGRVRMSSLLRSVKQSLIYRAATSASKFTPFFFLSLHSWRQLASCPARRSTSGYVLLI